MLCMYHLISLLNQACEIGIISNILQMKIGPERPNSFKVTQEVESIVT